MRIQNYSHIFHDFDILHLKRKSMLLSIFRIFRFRKGKFPFYDELCSIFMRVDGGYHHFIRLGCGEMRQYHWRMLLIQNVLHSKYV